MHDCENHGSQKVADSVPESISKYHGATDIDRGPFCDVDGQCRLECSDAGSSQKFSSGPILPVTNGGLGSNRLDGMSTFLCFGNFVLLETYCG